MRLLKIGRDSNCDIVLHSDKASALHAEITILNNGDILLEDKNSRNGTFVMNRPIKPGTQVSIKRGDAIRFGDVELIWNQIPMPENLSNYKAVYGIGTSMRNDIQIAGNTASRYHATLKIDRKGKAYLQDHSKNGSTINGERLNPGQTRPIKRGDAIVCGGVPVNLTQFIPDNKLSKIIGVAATIAVLVVCGWAGWKYIPVTWNNSIAPVTTQAMENASVCVYGSYLFEAKIKNDPLKDAQIEGWPKVWRFGHDGNGNLVSADFGMRCKDFVQIPSNKIVPFSYTGTAFFISINGELGTNRHIAVPWEYEKDNYDNDMRNFVTKIYKEFAARLALSSSSNMMEADAKFSRLQNVDLDISGNHELFGIGYCGDKTSLLSLNPVQTIAESGDPKKDVALIRLQNRRTPDHLVKMGAIYDLSKAVLDEQTLKPLSEELSIVGYPMGETVTNESFDGKELHPTMHTTKISRLPDDNQIQIQATGIGGFSGSPVSDSKHRLVGVLCSGFRGTDVTYCCNIKHLVELYNKHRVRE